MSKNILQQQQQQQQIRDCLKYNFFYFDCPVRHYKDVSFLVFLHLKPLAFESVTFFHYLPDNFKQNYNKNLKIIINYRQLFNSTFSLTFFKQHFLIRAFNCSFKNSLCSATPPHFPRNLY